VPDPCRRGPGLQLDHGRHRYTYWTLTASGAVSPCRWSDFGHTAPRMTGVTTQSNERYPRRPSGMCPGNKKPRRTLRIRRLGVRVPPSAPSSEAWSRLRQAGTAAEGPISGPKQPINGVRRLMPPAPAPRARKCSSSSRSASAQALPLSCGPGRQPRAGRRGDARTQCVKGPGVVLPKRRGYVPKKSRIRLLMSVGRCTIRKWPTPSINSDCDPGPQWSGTRFTCS
jgi:hypothetical protein